MISPAELRVETWSMVGVGEDDTLDAFFDAFFFEANKFQEGITSTSELSNCLLSIKDRKSGGSLSISLFNNVSYYIR